MPANQGLIFLYVGVVSINISLQTIKINHETGLEEKRMIKVITINYLKMTYFPTQIHLQVDGEIFHWKSEKITCWWHLRKDQRIQSH